MTPDRKKELQARLKNSSYLDRAIESIADDLYTGRKSLIPQEDFYVRPLKKSSQDQRAYQAEYRKKKKLEDPLYYKRAIDKHRDIPGVRKVPKEIALDRSRWKRDEKGRMVKQ